MKWIENIKRKKEPYIGEIYAGYFRGLCTSGLCNLNTAHGPGQMVIKDFFLIKQSDIKNSVAGKIQIHGEWFNEDQMFRYDDIYKPLREEILKKYNKETK